MYHCTSPTPLVFHLPFDITSRMRQTLHYTPSTSRRLRHTLSTPLDSSIPFVDLVKPLNPIWYPPHCPHRCLKRSRIHLSNDKSFCSTSFHCSLFSLASFRTPFHFDHCYSFQYNTPPLSFVCFRLHSSSLTLHHTHSHIIPPLFHYANTSNLYYCSLFHYICVRHTPHSFIVALFYCFDLVYKHVLSRWNPGFCFPSLPQVSFSLRLASKRRRTPLFIQLALLSLQLSFTSRYKSPT